MLLAGVPMFCYISYLSLPRAKSRAERGNRGERGLRGKKRGKEIYALWKDKKKGMEGGEKPMSPKSAGQSDVPGVSQWDLDALPRSSPLLSFFGVSPPLLFLSFSLHLSLYLSLVSSSKT